LIRANVAVERELAFLDHLESGIVLQPGNEEDPGHAPAGEHGVVDIATIDGHNRTGVQTEGIGQLHVAPLGFGEQHVGGQVVVMIQQDVGFDASLGAAEFGPRKYLQAQRDGSRVQRQEFVLEAELMLFAAEHLLVAKPDRSGPEQFLEERGRAVLVCIRQGRAARSFGDSQMDQPPQTARQTVADLAQGVGAA
jgi:hypothetical protein